MIDRHDIDETGQFCLACGKTCVAIDDGALQCVPETLRRWNAAFAEGAANASAGNPLALPYGEPFTFELRAFKAGHLFRLQEMQYLAAIRAEDAAARLASRRRSSPAFVRRLRFSH